MNRGEGIRGCERKKSRENKKPASAFAKLPNTGVRRIFNIKVFSFHRAFLSLIASYNAFSIQNYFPGNTDCTDRKAFMKFCPPNILSSPTTRLPHTGGKKSISRRRLTTEILKKKKKNSEFRPIALKRNFLKFNFKFEFFGQLKLKLIN